MSGPDRAAEREESKGFLVDSHDKNQQERGENTLISDGFGHASAWKLWRPCDHQPQVLKAAGELAEGQDRNIKKGGTFKTPVYGSPTKTSADARIQNFYCPTSDATRAPWEQQPCSHWLLGPRRNNCFQREREREIRPGSSFTNTP